jgi:hypothetical protein
MQELPLSMIPTFAVPFWIILHIISLIKLRNPQAGVEELRHNKALHLTAFPMRSKSGR